jgi:hypothetical protein
MSRTRPGTIARGASLAIALGLWLAAPALGAAPGVAAARRAIDPRVGLLFEHRDRTGSTLGFFRRSAAFEGHGRAPLLLRLARPLTGAERGALSSSGVTLGPALASGAVRAEASASALAALEALAEQGALVRATVALPPRFIALPLDQGRAELGLRGGLEALRASTGRLLSGEGVVVGDLDGPADPFHPAFFRALAPVAWVDVDGDGTLGPGIDGVDVDGDGAIAPGEVLRLLDGRARSLFAESGAIAGTDSAGFDPGWDYLYLDTDGDGRRTFGPLAAGADGLAALGEPLFVADDVDGDGLVGRRERVFPLGNSKFRAIARGGQIYARGQGLGGFDPSLEPAAALAHGTMVLGAVAGGQPEASRFLGYAPGVELVLSAIGEGDDEPLTDKLSWLREQGAEIILTEVGLWGTEPSDGSTELELLIDALVEQGVVVVSPTGNLASSGKHASALVPAQGGGTYQAALTWSGDPPGAMGVSITWADGAEGAEGALDLGGGEVIELGPSSASGETPGGRAYAVARGVTAKGAGFALLTVSGQAPVLPAAGASLSLRGTGAGPLHASLFVVDDASGWQGGARFQPGDAAGSMVSPSFSARTLAVGAYALHAGSEFSFYPQAQPGSLRPFSGRGPDLFGGDGVDVAAPDDPIGASPDRYHPETGGDGALCRYAEGGGTSGAAAAVAGLAALFRELDPALMGASLRQQVLSGAIEDDQVLSGAPSLWGVGKLRLGVVPSSGEAPRVVIKGASSALPGEAVRLEASLVVPSAGTLVRWDDGYDGAWDTGFVPPGERLVEMPPTGPLAVKIEALDQGGRTSRASFLVASGRDGEGGGGAAGGSPGAGAGAGGEPPVDPAGRPSPDGAPAGCGCGQAGRVRPGERPAALVALLAWLGFALHRSTRRPARVAVGRPRSEAP